MNEYTAARHDAQRTCVTGIGGGSGGHSEDAAAASNDGWRRREWTVDIGMEGEKVKGRRHLRGEGQGEPGTIIGGLHGLCCRLQRQGVA